jgi:hypothetical protein
MLYVTEGERGGKSEVTDITKVEKPDLLLGFLKSNENWDAESVWRFHPQVCHRMGS